MNILSMKDKSRTSISSPTPEHFISKLREQGYSDFEIGNTGDITCKNPEGRTYFFIVLGDDIVPFDFGGKR